MKTTISKLLIFVLFLIIVGNVYRALCADDIYSKLEGVAQGTVLDVHSQEVGWRMGHTTTWSYVYEYTVNGNTYQKSTDYSTTRFGVGEKIEIHYDVNNPTTAQAISDYEDRQRENIGLIIVTTLCVAIFLLEDWSKWKKVPEVQEV